jgi:hypothetical protein
MALVRTPSGNPTLSEVAVALSDPRVGIGSVKREDVLSVARTVGIVRESRIPARHVSTVYFALARQRAFLPPIEQDAPRRATGHVVDGEVLS